MNVLERWHALKPQRLLNQTPNQHANIKINKKMHTAFTSAILNPKVLEILFIQLLFIYGSIWSLFSCKPNDVITYLICIIEKC